MEAGVAETERESRVRFLQLPAVPGLSWLWCVYMTCKERRSGCRAGPHPPIQAFFFSNRDPDDHFDPVLVIKGQQYI